MGNITAIIVVCSVCGGLILFLLFLWRHLNKRGQKSKLDKEIEKYKNLNNGQVDSSDKSLAQKKVKEIKKEEKVSVKTKKLQEKLNKKVQIESLEESTAFENEEVTNKEENPFVKRKVAGFEPEPENKENEEKRDQDFENFLNEYSYTRAVGDKDLMKQLKNLSPKVKALLLGKIFNKFDD